MANKYLLTYLLANFQLILDCFIPNFKLKHEDPENIKADRASTVTFNLHQIKHQVFFWDTWQIQMHSDGYKSCQQKNIEMHWKKNFLSESLRIFSGSFAVCHS